MAETLQMSGAGQTIQAIEAAAQASSLLSGNGVRYARYGDLGPVSRDLERLVGTVPRAMSEALGKTVFYFVPLAIPAARDQVEDRGALVAPMYTEALAERAICHRNVKLADHEGVFLSARLHADSFALAFELFINVAHGFVDTAGVHSEFSDLVWSQARAAVKGETSHDAWEMREKALPKEGAADEKAKTEFLEAAFVDALAIYMLSLYLDVDYADLRERDYPLLDARALADRLRAVNKLFPANAGYTFAIRYRRR
jgi:hypothetical protein